MLKTEICAESFTLQSLTVFTLTSYRSLFIYLLGNTLILRVGLDWLSIVYFAHRPAWVQLFWHSSPYWFSDKGFLEKLLLFRKGTDKRLGRTRDNRLVLCWVTPSICQFWLISLHLDVFLCRGCLWHSDCPTDNTLLEIMLGWLLLLFVN